MKKTLPLVFVAATVGAALWFALGRSASELGALKEAPRIASTLPITTAGLVGVHDVHTLSARLLPP